MLVRGMGARQIPFAAAHSICWCLSQHRNITPRVHAGTFDEEWKLRHDPGYSTILEKF
jgi:hypothetical protein